MARAKDEVRADPSLYERDFALWIDEQVDLLRQRAFDGLDLPNLIDELESIVRSDKRSLESDLIVVLRHLLKHRHQPARRSRSWLLSIAEHRRRVRGILKDSPSLRRHLGNEFAECYAAGRHQAIIETGLSEKRFPKTPPWTLEQVLDPDFLPD